MTFGTELEILLASVVAGVLGSMLGLGAGVFFVPILSVFFGVPLKAAVAASAISVIVNSTGGTAVYLKNRMTNVRLALVMELTTTLGAIGGGVIVILISTNVLRLVLGLSLLGMGAALFFRRGEAPPITEGPDPLRLRQTYTDPVKNVDVTYIPTRTGAGLGSDHRWVLADLTVPARPAPTDQSAASSLAR